MAVKDFVQEKVSCDQNLKKCLCRLLFFVMNKKEEGKVMLKMRVWV